MAVSDRGSTVAHFQGAYDHVAKFMELLDQHYARTPFPQVADDLPLLQNCIALLQEESLTRAARATRVVNCQASAGVIARALASPLKPLGEPEPEAPSLPTPRDGARRTPRRRGSSQEASA